MYCYQCQEAAKGVACTIKGVCGKDDELAKLQDLLTYIAKGVAIFTGEKRKAKALCNATNLFLMESLFMTVTNVSFDEAVLKAKIREGLVNREKHKAALAEMGITPNLADSDAATWTATTDAELFAKAETIGVLSTENVDVRSLRELIIYGLKGMAAYTHHAYILGKENVEVYAFMEKALVASIDPSLGAAELLALVLETGKYGVDVMALLDGANTGKYGNPEITEVNLGVGTNPGILISGHDLKDMEQLLIQTEGTGVDVYTHSEMLPAHYYPAFKKFKHFVGNYGNAWWLQDKEFASFNGPILMTTNCVTPPKDSYKDRLYTTGLVNFAGVKHIADGENGEKDFSALVAQAKTCAAPIQIEEGKIVGGFAHHQIGQLADKVVAAVKSGAIRKFVVMAGCDGRSKKREYYTEFASEMPQDTVILTAGCAKYRYNKLDMGTIGGIPRVLDAGQCNDSYSLAVTALRLKEAFGLEDINELPISYNIAWYEQKAVIVLLALLHLGVKKIHLGPTLPAFLSPGVVDVLVNSFGLSGIGTVEEDMETLVGTAVLVD
jgi:hydroxylamine reductase